MAVAWPALIPNHLWHLYDAGFECLICVKTALGYLIKPSWQPTRGPIRSEVIAELVASSKVCRLACTSPNLGLVVPSSSVRKHSTARHGPKIPALGVHSEYARGGRISFALSVYGFQCRERAVRNG